MHLHVIYALMGKCMCWGKRGWEECLEEKSEDKGDKVARDKRLLLYNSDSCWPDHLKGKLTFVLEIIDILST